MTKTRIHKAQLRKRKIVIQNIDAAAAANDYGEQDLTAAGTWQTYATRYAQVQSRGGREFWKIDKVEATVDWVFTVLRDATTAAITPQMRISYDSRIFQVVAAIDVDDLHHEMQIQCREVV